MLIAFVQLSAELASASACQGEKLGALTASLVSPLFNKSWVLSSPVTLSDISVKPHEVTRVLGYHTRVGQAVSQDW